MKQAWEQNDVRGKGKCVCECECVCDVALSVACVFDDDSLTSFTPTLQIGWRNVQRPGQWLTGHPEDAITLDCSSSRCSPWTAHCVGSRPCLEAFLAGYPGTCWEVGSQNRLLNE